MASIKVLQISDLHILPHAGDTMLGIDTEHYFQATLAQAHAKQGGFDLLLLTGDLGQDPCADSYQRICRHLQSYNTPALCLPGNHDDSSLMATHLNQGLVSCQKHKILGNWQVICMNSQKPGSPSGLLSVTEMGFLEHTLANCALPALLAVHHHCVSSNSSWMDSMQIENSAAFLKLASQFSQVKAITFGHIHQELVAKYQDIILTGTPATCFQFKPGATEFALDTLPPGYRVFELFEDGSLTSDCHRIESKQSGLQFAAHGY